MSWALFTLDLTNCDCLFRAGIPIWLVRPYSELHSICVKKLIPLQVADGIIPLHATLRPTHPTIYFGGSDDITKYYAIAQHITGHLCYPNAFGSICAKKTGCTTTGPNEEGGMSTTVHTL
jgi:hypothetical protein